MYERFGICWQCGTARNGLEDPTFVRADDDGPAETTARKRQFSLRTLFSITTGTALLLCPIAAARAGSSGWLGLLCLAAATVAIIHFWAWFFPTLTHLVRQKPTRADSQLTSGGGHRTLARSGV